MLFFKLSFLALVVASVALPNSFESLEATDGTAATISDVENARARTSVVLCTGAFPREGCKTVSLSVGKCSDFKKSTRAYYKALTGARIPRKIFCTMYRNFNCTDEAADYAFLHGGAAYNLATENVPNGYGTLVNFDDQAASIICKPMA